MTKHLKIICFLKTFYRKTTEKLTGEFVVIYTFIKEMLQSEGNYGQTKIFLWVNLFPNSVKVVYHYNVQTDHGTLAAPIIVY